MLKRGPSDSHAHEVSGIPNAGQNHKTCGNGESPELSCDHLFLPKAFLLPFRAERTIAIHRKVSCCTPPSFHAPGQRAFLQYLCFPRRQNKRGKDSGGSAEKAAFPPHDRNGGCPARLRRGLLCIVKVNPRPAPRRTAARLAPPPSAPHPPSQTAALDGQVSFAFLPLRVTLLPIFKSPNASEGLPISF